uniref:Uncharacterized protein C2orf81 homolog n=1 Tax=Phallusia mammillata TaxID=59560 RepID=A0A6F9D7I4_9ASCI|nr:uncharacterized protein C2orf81 homolog [Phallusia mammillata]
MSRQAASKSRAEKSRGGAGGTQSVPVPTISSDVVPGRLTDGDWGRLMCDEEDSGFIGSLVESIIDDTLTECYKKYIWKQVLPFTVHQAKEDLLRIVQWQFLSHDPGETEISNDPGWTEDSEPEPGIIDSWAQGSVPVVIRPQSSSIPSVSLISEDPGFLQEPTATTISDEQTDSSEKSPENTQTTDDKTVLSPTAKSPEIGTDGLQFPSAIIKKKKASYKRHVGRLLPPKLSYTEQLGGLEDNDQNKNKQQNSDAHLSPSQKSLLKVQAGRPPGNREVTFDDKGNVVGVMKLNTQTLPSHKVRVQYDIIDPEAEANAQRLAALRTGKVRKSKKQNWNSLDESSVVTKGWKSHPKSGTTLGKSVTSTSTILRRNRKTALSVHHIPTEAMLGSEDKLVELPAYRKKHTRARIDPLPPSLIDTIDASPGVIIREGGQIKSGPEEKYPAGLFQASKNVEAVQRKPILRLLGSTKVNYRLRPTVDPGQIVGDVQSESNNFSVHKVLPPVMSPQTATS